MMRTEERGVRLTTSGDTAVDGIVRVRRFGLHAGDAFRIGFSRHEPVAVVVRRRGGEERIPIPRGGGARTAIALAGMPLAAHLAKSILAHRGRRT